MKNILHDHLFCCKAVVVSIALSVIYTDNANADTIQTTVPALKEVYAHDFKIGCLLSYRHVGFADDPYVPGQSSVIAPNGGDLIKYHMNSMSPGNNMKTAYTVDLTASAAAYSAASAADKDSVNTHPVVRFNGDLIAQLNWAQRQGFTFRGHTLVWHNSAPAAFFYTGYSTSNSRVTKEVMTERMENYIHQVIRLIHEGWPGLLSAMDVVNEAINDNTGTFRTSGNEWYTTFGDNTYVMKAFEFARQFTELYGETQMKLYYNDYNTYDANKADGIVNLLTPIFQAGYLDGIGMQEHDGNSVPAIAQWILSYNKFDPLCTEMAVTELDVTTGSSNPTAGVLETQANQYAALFKCFTERSYYSGRGKIINVSKDGLNDQYTFKTNQSSSLWDSDNQCKPSFYAVADVGIYYNLLDSLITKADEYDENDYPPDRWTDFEDALSYAVDILNLDYSNDVSAPDALSDASEDLETAIDQLLLTSVDNSITGIDYNTRPFGYLTNGTIYLRNIPVKSLVYVYSFDGSLLETLSADSETITIPVSTPCIIRIQSGNEHTILKMVR